MNTLRDQAVRQELGISALRAADLAGVARNTVRMYEIDPLAVTPRPRKALAELYTLLRSLLERAPRATMPRAA